MLNMLIAIMGDSFDRVIENKEVNSTKMKLSILESFSNILPQQDATQRHDTVLIAARRADPSADEGDEWEGTIKKLTRVVESTGRRVESRLGTKVERLQTTVEELSRKSATQERHLRAHIDSSVKVQAEKINANVK